MTEQAIVSNVSDLLTQVEELDGECAMLKLSLREQAARIEELEDRVSLYRGTIRRLAKTLKSVTNEDDSQ